MKLNPRSFIRGFLLRQGYVGQDGGQIALDAFLRPLIAGDVGAAGVDIPCGAQKVLSRSLEGLDCSFFQSGVETIFWSDRD